MVVTPVAMLAILIASIVLMSQGKASYYAWNQDKVRENLYRITLEVIFAFSYSLDLSQISLVLRTDGSVLCLPCKHFGVRLLLYIVRSRFYVLF